MVTKRYINKKTPEVRREKITTIERSPTATRASSFFSAPKEKDPRPTRPHRKEIKSNVSPILFSKAYLVV